jgi:hypothetical protein
MPLQYNDQDSSDYTIILPLSSKTLHVHRQIVAPVIFWAASSENHTLEYKVDESKEDPQIVEQAFEHTIKFLYEGSIDSEIVSSIRLVAEIAKLAVQYQLADLIAVCRETLSGKISVDNACYILELCSEEEFADLQEDSIIFYRVHTEEILEKESLLPIPYELFAMLMGMSWQDPEEQLALPKIQQAFTRWQAVYPSRQEKYSWTQLLQDAEISETTDQ